jgi:hypothetical protein
MRNRQRKLILINSSITPFSNVQQLNLHEMTRTDLDSKPEEVGIWYTSDQNYSLVQDKRQTIACSRIEGWGTRIIGTMFESSIEREPDACYCLSGTFTQQWLGLSYVCRSLIISTSLDQILIHPNAIHFRLRLFWAQSAYDSLNLKKSITITTTILIRAERSNLWMELRDKSQMTRDARSPMAN